MLQGRIASMSPRGGRSLMTAAGLMVLHKNHKLEKDSLTPQISPESHSLVYSRLSQTLE